MSQHDFDIANGSGASVRADLNAALGAIATQNSGATAPATTFSNMLWYDTTTGILKIRNAANTAWLTMLESLGAYPVGSIYINAAVATNPATLLGFGTWSAFGTGRVLVGVDAADTSFDAIGEMGGSKDAIVVTHTHTATSTATEHTHATPQGLSGVGGYAFPGGSGGLSTTSGATVVSVATTVASTGSSGTNANLQPYITVYMWRRTA